MTSPTYHLPPTICHLPPATYLACILLGMLVGMLAAPAEA